MNPPEKWSGSNPPRVAVIGAGIAGLSCARALQEAGVSVVVFEKSRSLGGRCATRRWEGHVVDHGAQYFTVRSEEFRAVLDAVCPGDMDQIRAAFLDATGEEIPAESSRWFHRQGNNRLGKALLGGLPIRMETPVDSVVESGGQWLLGGESFSAVVSTAPWPQTARLLGVSAGEDYAPCLTAFFSYEGSWAGTSEGVYARLDRESALAWSACENHKAGRVIPGQTVFVAQASPAWSGEFFEAPPEQWAAELQVLLEERWALPKDARRASFTHRWRFARLITSPELPELPAGFFISGDARSESRVESAWLAGLQTATQVIEWCASKS